MDLGGQKPGGILDAKGQVWWGKSERAREPGDDSQRVSILDLKIPTVEWLQV